MKTHRESTEKLDSKLPQSSKISKVAFVVMTRAFAVVLLQDNFDCTREHKVLAWSRDLALAAR